MLLRQPRVAIRLGKWPRRPKAIATVKDAANRAIQAMHLVPILVQVNIRIRIGITIHLKVLFHRISTTTVRIHRRVQAMPLPIRLQQPTIISRPMSFHSHRRLRLTTIVRSARYCTVFL